MKQQSRTGIEDVHLRIALVDHDKRQTGRVVRRRNPVRYGPSTIGQALSMQRRVLSPAKTGAELRLRRLPCGRLKIRFLRSGVRRV